MFVGQLHSLEERAASTETGATLTVGGAVVPVPLLRGGTQADQADYVECVDVSKPASCVAYDANNWVLNHTIPVSTNARTHENCQSRAWPSLLDLEQGALQYVSVELHEGHSGPTVGALNAESPKQFFPKFRKIIWSQNKCFSYGFAPYFA